MQLIDCLNPVQETLQQDHLGKQTLGASISVYTETLPDFDGAHLALVGIEGWGTKKEGFLTGDLSELRSVLYDYRGIKKTTYIVDLGDLKHCSSHDAFLDQITFVAKALLSQKVLPLFFGGTQDIDLAIYKALKELDVSTHYTTIDNRFDLGVLGEEPLQKAYLSQIIEHDAERLESFFQIGFQTYLVNENKHKVFEKRRVEKMRLGDVRASIQDTEPFLRASNFVSFDLSALKRKEFKSSTSAHTFGLTGEEACQLTWYAGCSESLQVISFTEFQELSNSDDIETLATLMWYFIEGLYNRQESMDFESDNYITYNAPLIDYDVAVVFVKSMLTNRWWFKSEEKYIPCNYSDYKKTTEGEITPRVFKYILE